MNTWKRPHHLAPRNRVGTVSLIVSAAGFLVLEAGHLLAWFDGPVWTLARGGFEAAVIGGLADWFAVRALFRALPPSPFPALPHTNLVVAKRLELTDGIVDMLERQILSPTTLKERLGKFSASDLLIEKLESEAGRSAAIDALIGGADRLARELEEDEELRRFVADAIRGQLREAELGPTVGAWLLRRIQTGDTKAIWMAVAGTLAEEAEAGAFDSALADALAAAIASVREENAWRGMVFRWFVSSQHDIRHLRTALAEALWNQSTDGSHGWNEQLDAAVTKLAHRLTAGDPETLANLKKVQEHFAASLDIEPLLTHVAADLRVALQNSRHAPPDEARRMLTDAVMRIVARLKADQAAQEKIDASVRDGLRDLASRYHHVIGTTARESIDSLPDETLVAELEGKVGQDLQFIRLNGAVIGGSVGVAIAAVRMLV